MATLYKGFQDPNKSILVVGTGEEATEIQKELNGQGIAPRIQVVSPDVLQESLQDREDVAAICCVSGGVKSTDVLFLCCFCQENNVKLFFCMPELSALQKNMSVRNVGFLSFISPVDEPLSHWWNRILKRLLDLSLGTLFLVLFFPFIYIVAAVIIKRKSAGPVFSIIRERGKGGKPFERVLFRTADLPAESFLQKNYIKSLPQFLNVFMGSMSIVGLKLQREGNVPATYKFAKPGMLNCLFCKNADVWYTQNWSLWLDLKVIAKAMLNKNKKIDN